MLESYFTLPQEEQTLKIRITRLIDNQLLNHIDNISAPIYDRHNHTADENNIYEIS
jgi:hypothetical protein